MRRPYPVARSASSSAGTGVSCAMVPRINRRIARERFASGSDSAFTAPPLTRSMVSANGRLAFFLPRRIRLIVEGWQPLPI